MTDPFLTIVTRCCKRPQALMRNLSTVAAQLGSVPFEQLLIVDRQHRGLRWANERFHVTRAVPRGEYIYLADDDHWFDNCEFVTDVHSTATLMDYPDLMLCRIVQGYPDNRVLPPDMIWNVNWEAGERPALWVGAGTCIVIKREIWQTNAWRYHRGQGVEWHTGGDWHFVTGLLGLDLRIVRTNAIGVTGQRNRGSIEPSVGKGWFEQATAEFMPTRIGSGLWRIEYG